MRKKSAYLYFLAVAAILIAAAFVLNISFIKSAVHSVLHMVSSPWVCAAAAVSAFIFTGNKHYWLVNIAVALIVAVLIQFFIIGGSFVPYTILMRALAFLCIVYVLNLVRVLFTR